MRRGGLIAVAVGLAVGVAAWAVGLGDDVAQTGLSVGRDTLLSGLEALAAAIAAAATHRGARPPDGQS